MRELSEVFEEDAIVHLAMDLDRSGLIWHPEIGDEVIERSSESRISILVDPQGLGPEELREVYVWLPTLEQLVEEIEVRNALLYHAGVCEGNVYEAVIKTELGVIEAQGESLRLALANALLELIANSVTEILH